MSSKARFLKNSVIYTLGDLLPKIISFFIIPLATTYMAKEEFGIYGYITSIVGFFSMMYVLGLDGALTRFYYEYEKNKEQSKLVSTIWIFLIIYNSLLSIILIFFGQGISKFILKDIPVDPYLKLLVLFAFFTTFSSIPLVLLRLKEQALKFGIFNLLTTIVNVSLIVYFVKYKSQGAVGNLKANIITYAIFSLVYLFITLKDIKFTFSLNTLKASLRYGIPLIPHAVGAWVLMVSDRYFLKIYRDNGELGIYNLGYQFGMLVYFLIVAINKAYVPFFLKTAEEEKDTSEKVFGDILKYYAILIISIGFGLALFSREIITIMVPNKEYYLAAAIVPLIAIAYVFNGFYYMSVNGIFYSKKTYILPFSTGISAIVSLVLNYLLIPRYGMYGAALATIGAYASLFFITYIYSQRFYYIKWQWKSIIGNSILCIAIYLLSMINIESLLLSIAYKIVLFSVYIAMLFIMRILSFDKLKYYGLKIAKRK